MFALALGANGDARSKNPSVSAVVDDVAAETIGEGKIQGLVVVVAQEGSVVLERGYGLAHKEGNVEMTHGTVIDYFSIGKHITAAILLRLAERDELRLDSSASDYLPDGDFEDAEVTVRQLLSHTSGLWEAEEDENELSARYAEPPPEGAVLEWANHGERLAEPGETWMYSNGGYLFSGQIAERLTGDTLENFYINEFALPLDLKKFGGCADLDGELASGYSYERGEARLIADVHAGWWGGSGNVCGTAGDLMRWWFALRSGRVLSPDSTQQMFSPTTLRRQGSQTDFGYGLGIRIGEIWGNAKIGHTGSGSGGTATLAEYPEAGLVVLAIVNTAGDDVRTAIDIETEIAAHLLNADTSSPESKPIPANLLTAAPGLYRSPTNSFCVSARGTELWRSVDDTDAERMRYTGNGQFISQDGDYEVSGEYFLGTKSGKAQWFGYDYNGFPQDLAVRVGDECG